jgi:hypothetical protein
VAVLLLFSIKTSLTTQLINYKNSCHPGKFEAQYANKKWLVLTKKEPKYTID